MPRRNVAVKVLPSDVRDPSCGACSMPRPTCSRTCPRIRRSSPSTRRGSRPTAGPYIVMEYCPGRSRSGTASSGSRSRRCSPSASGWRARSSPRTAPVWSTATSSRATSSSRPSARPSSPTSASRPRCARDRRRGARDVVPWSAPEVVAEQTAGTVASEVWSLGADRVLAARRTQPVRATRAGPEHQGAAAPPHRARELHRSSRARTSRRRCRTSSRAR